MAQVAETDSSSLLANMMKQQGESEDPSTSIEFHQAVLEYKIDWSRYPATQENAAPLLRLLEPGAAALKNKAVMSEHAGVLDACTTAFSIQDDPKPLQFVLTILYDMLREDSSCFSLLEDALRDQVNFYEPLLLLLQRQDLDHYVADKASWLVSAIIGNLSNFFADENVVAILRVVCNGNGCTELGKLEAITNLLKAVDFRQLVWEHEGVADVIFRVQKTAGSQTLYKLVFALWMLSFDEAIVPTMSKHSVVKKLKDVLAYSRVEKVVRLGLTVLKNFLGHKAICEDIVEEGVLEVVQQLEFEKWRDEALYEEIRDIAALIHIQVKEMSNFERYVRELDMGKLSWGYIHSDKFWAENVMKFEQNEFKALKDLCKLMCDEEKGSTTLAVACHDVGEFVQRHPLGKKKVTELGVKQRVMELMATTDPEKREVRREALLCCQKIMLNKWQDMADAAA